MQLPNPYTYTRYRCDHNISEKKQFDNFLLICLYSVKFAGFFFFFFFFFRFIHFVQIIWHVTNNRFLELKNGFVDRKSPWVGG